MNSISLRGLLRLAITLIAVAYGLYHMWSRLRTPGRSCSARMHLLFARAHLPDLRATLRGRTATKALDYALARARRGPSPLSSSTRIHRHAHLYFDDLTGRHDPRRDLIVVVLEGPGA